ncbi:baseplate J/gp47 family protein [Oleidesulfovibrio alaskensis]|jgi:uncharacterized phage protein gp47/JayE|uniref:baseplate J/gp47 family protein n=1 Tax=Oleidesulfovibrio alaskensis TaxID=58180 RepID=UPI000422AF54|nr:baseplate J/gp47 family protein [Oleidesulfovibrio alaskensis]
MPYITPDFAAIRQGILRDTQNLQPDAATLPDSDNYVRASATASAIEGLYQHQLWIARQILPDTADTEYLEIHCGLRGITRKPATRATGTLTLHGAPQTPAAAGIRAAHPASGEQFATTAAAVLDETGTAAVPCRAVTAKALPDYTAEPVTLVNAPSGILSGAQLSLAGGTDAESDAQLLERLLLHMRTPPGGGNRYDYQRWALEVPGVTAAFVYPLRRGLGTVDVAVLSADGLPAAELVTAVQAHIDAQRPVTAAGVTVLAPQPLMIDVHAAVRLQGTTLPVVTAQLQQSLAVFFAALLPGDLVVRSHLEALISGMAGVQDRQLITPAANVQAVVDATRLQWPRPGQVTLEAM